LTNGKKANHARQKEHTEAQKENLSINSRIGGTPSITNPLETLILFKYNKMLYF